MTPDRLRLSSRPATAPGAAGASTALDFERHRTLYRARQLDVWQGRARWIAAAALAVLLLALTAWVVLGAPAAGAVLLAAAVGVTVLIWRVVRLPEPLLHLQQQARAERGTARELDRLSDAGYRVLHDRMLSANHGVRLSHLVVGPTGMFFVETRRVSGPVRVTNGVLWDGDLSLQGAMQRVWWIAEQVVSALQVEAPQWKVVVVPRSALHGAELQAGLVSEGVGVVPADHLVRSISAMAPTIAPMDVAYLGECAQRAFPPAAA